MTDLQARIKTALSDRYAIERELGSGGMATVYLAEDLKHHRQVAVKVLRPELAATLGRDRFFREIEVAARLQHPHILPLHDSGAAASDEFLYYVMPYVDGESLRGRLARVGELPVQEAVRILIEVVDALAYAHSRGVVHRDMKPDNVMISGRHALVMDFGVAKAVSEATGVHALTTAGVALGTPAYMAPEQAAADPLLDHRVDIYAVGIMGYELLSGRPPFVGMSTPQILAAHVTQAPDSLLSRRPACPPALAAVIMRCLEKRPADRWQSAEELLHQLEAMGTPTGGTAPTGAVSAVGLATPPAAASPAPTPAAPVRPAPGSFRRSGYLVLGILLALVAAWGVMRPRGSAPVAATASARRVVVLPFENQGDSSRQYFANGVSEAITTQLTGIAGLSVIPRSTAARYRGSNKSLADIGRELGVGYVLEGTVQFEEVKGGPPRVRVSPELIRVSDTSSVWAHGYDGVMSSVFQVYSDVAQQVARSLEVALNDPERRAMAVKPTASPEAYDLYLRANDYLNRGLSLSNFNTAIPMLERAVALDSNFALAWGRMSETLALAHWLYFTRTDAVMARAEAAAKRALALQPDLPEAHRAMGNLYYRRREYDKALAEFAIVQQSQPNSVDLLASIAYVYRRQGRWDESLAEMRKRLQLDPASPLAFNDVGETLNLMRRYAEATEVLQHCIEIAPDEPDCYGWLANVQARQDTALGPPQATLRRALARINAGRLLAINPPDPKIIVGDDSLRQAFLAADRAGFGRTASDFYLFRGDQFRTSGDAAGARANYDSARTILATELQRAPDDYGWHQRMGVVLARLGRFEDGIREARRAAELMTPAKDAYFGIDALIDLAKCYAAAGRAREAVEQLKIALAVPSRISVSQLRSQSDWDPIRNDAEFRNLVVSH